VYRVLAAEPELPGRLALMAPRMAAQDWLGSYREFAVLEQVIAGMQRRLSRPQLLDGSLAELERLYQPLSEDFRAFYPELIAFARQA
jgi:acyl carrier protein phosphodiesterase